MGDLLANYEEFGDIPINKVMLAGSHDSGTYEMGASARTQNKTIAEQLELGIRYFDLRPKVHNSVFYIHHGILSSDTLLGTWPPADLDSGTEIFAQIRAFLKLHPAEIIILKFQDFSNFGHDDYKHFAQLLRKYMTFDVELPVRSRCTLVAPPVRASAGGDVGVKTVRRLVETGPRVFAFFQAKDVPKKMPALWDYVWTYEPSKERRPADELWDPFWEDFSTSMADDKAKEVATRWFPFHEANHDTWDGRGFFVMQAQMQVLHGTDLCSAYFNKAERSAKATSGEFTDPDKPGDLISNNARNADKFIEWAGLNRPLNIMASDFVEYGGLASKIHRYYRTKLTPKG